MYLRIAAFVILFVVVGCAGTSNRRHVTRQEFGDAWPLTVESGELECVQGHAIIFHHMATKPMVSTAELSTWAIHGSIQSGT